MGHLDREGTYTYLVCTNPWCEDGQKGQWYHENDMKRCYFCGGQLESAPMTSDPIEKERRMRQLGLW